jgi:hypothetical protein
MDGWLLVNWPNRLNAVNWPKSELAENGIKGE